MISFTSLLIVGAVAVAVPLFLGLVPAVAKQLEGGHPLLVATDDFAVDQARAHFKVVHSLDHQRIASCPVVTITGDQPDAWDTDWGDKGYFYMPLKLSW